jgi:predicted Zn-dependent protease
LSAPGKRAWAGAGRAGLLALCALSVSGFTPCVNQLRADPVAALAGLSERQGQAEARARAAQKECDALEARAIPFEEEHALGGAVSVNWVSRGGGLTPAPDARALHAQLNRIGKHLAALSGRPGLPWTFGVLASPGVNAVSGPGGYVFVSEGLLAKLENESQLAGVLAHEIAHVTAKHAVEEYRTLLVDQCQLGVQSERAGVVAEELRQGAEERAGALMRGLPPGALKDAFAAMQRSGAGGFDFDRAGRDFVKAVTDAVVQRLTDRGFRQEDEHAADAAALALVAAAGYQPGEYVRFLAQLPEKGLSTAHPRPSERQGRLRAQLEAWSAEAGRGEFTPADLSAARVVPLRDALRARRPAAR